MHPARQIVDFFDRRAADYRRQYEEANVAGYALRVRRRKVLDLFDQPGGRVLDVGCGPAVMTEHIIARGCRFWGLDPSGKTIAIAHDQYGVHHDVSFVQGDAASLPFVDRFFDAVLCMGVIDSLVNGPAAVEEMLRVLRPGGTLILSFANLLSPYAWWKNFGYYPLVGLWHRALARAGHPAMRQDRIRSCPLRRLYSRAGARRLVESNRARVTAIVPFYFNVFLSPLDELMPHIALSVTKKLEEGEWRCPESIAAGWIVKARKS